MIELLEELLTSPSTTDGEEELRMRAAAAELGIPVVHGADWGWDHPHHELDRKAYP